MSDKRIPQYRQIEKDLLEQINLGYYNKGDLIPTELELSRKYNVSRVTVRKATDSLVAHGILSRVAGVGTFVTKSSLLQNPAPILGFTASMKEQGLTPSTKVDTFTLQTAPPNIASMLKIEKGAPIYYIHRMRYGNGELLQLETTYMSAELYPDISIQILENSKYYYFEHIKGIKIAYSHHTVTPIHPSQQVAELFHIPADTPIIKAANITYLENGQVMDYTELILNSPKYQLTYIKG